MSGRIGSFPAGLAAVLTATGCSAAVAARGAGAAQPAPSSSYEVPFFAAAEYDAAVPTPESILGHAVGARPATSEAAVRCFREWARTSTRVQVRAHGRTYEGRVLEHAVFTSDKNMKRLDAIRAGAARLADPRGAAAAEIERLIETAPAIAWMGYGIHGDEISSTDAAIAVGYHLAACTDASVTRLLDDVVVIIDANMNPDGRERFIHQIEQANGLVANLDIQSTQHAGHWPWGRGNHYLFDLNRDWLAAVHPETRGRQAAIVSWHPHLLVDSHEMGPLDTYAFYPAREPFNPHLTETVKKWWPVFAADQARAFDRHGWSYYTREWMDMWYPGYSDSWSIFHGAIGILYEQAGVDGTGVRQRSGTVLTYREAVHHHVVSTMANLGTLARHRREILADFVAQKQRAVDASRPETARVFLLEPDRHPARVQALLDNLDRQGVEIRVAEQAFSAEDVVDRFGMRWAKRPFPAGTVLVPMRQPLGPLVAAVLEFDPHMRAEFLAEERRERQRRRPSKIYDVTAWSLPVAYDVAGYWAKRCEAATLRVYQPAAAPRGNVLNPDAAYGFVIDGSDDRAMRAVVMLLQRGVSVRVGEKEFSAGGRHYPRGSFLIRRQDQSGDWPEALRAAAEDSGVTITGTQTGRSPDEGPDLGAGRFRLLAKPRVAVLARGPVSFTSYGSVWHELDVRLGLGMSGLDADALGRVDLRRYNVLLVPDSFAMPAIRTRLKSSSGALRDWVHGGGTLIAIGRSAAAVADKSLDLTKVRLRRDVLDKLDDYAEMVTLERRAEPKPGDMARLWTQAASTQAAATQATEGGDRQGAGKGAEGKPEQLARRDEWARLFAPHGAILRGLVDREHWLTFGCDAALPVFVEGDRALMSMHPVQTPVRLAARPELRLSGLLWPEAAARLADTAYACVERSGKGQVILFVSDPAFRGMFRGTARLLANAILLGPGLGASPPLPW